MYCWCRSCLPVGTDIDPVTDTLGQVTWVMSSVAGLIYETEDRARTWSSVAPAGRLHWRQDGLLAAKLPGRHERWRPDLDQALVAVHSLEPLL